MPTYDYKCDKCGVFEYFQSIKDDPLTTCPHCGGSVTRLLSRNVNIIFKGSGFYVTDNRSSEYKRKANEEKSASSGEKGDTAKKAAVNE